MHTCKIDHSPEGMPSVLCRTCTPRAPAPVVEQTEDVAPRLASTFRKIKLRKLRREERRLSDLIDSIGRRDPAQTRRLYAAIKVVEDEIARVTS